MRSKRVMYCTWMLVFVMLVSVGCLEKEAQWHKKTIKKLESRMEVETGPGFKTTVDNLGKKKRSLALYIADDHSKLAALFMTKQFDSMAKEMGVGVTLDDNVMSDLKDISDYWKEQHDKKYNSLKPEEKQNFDSKYTIELQIWAYRISVSEYQSVRIANRTVSGTQVEYTSDGQSVEFFEFDVVLREVKNGKIVSNQSGNGEWPRGHSEECPWI